MNIFSLSRSAVRVIALGLLLGVVAQAQASATVNQPNIIVIMTDDQGVASFGFMPKVQSELAQAGVTFSNFHSITESIIIKRYTEHDSVCGQRFLFSFPLSSKSLTLSIAIPRVTKPD